MSSPFKRRRSARAVIAATGFGLVVTPVALPTAANAAPDGSNVVISEVYGGGGNSGATLKNDFVELYNPTDTVISLTGMSIQYRSAGGTGVPGASNVVVLNGSIAPHGHWLLQAAAGTGGTADLPTPDQTSSLAMGGTGGQVFRASQTTAVDPGTGSIASAPPIVDFVGWGSTASSYEGAPAGATSNTTSVSRNATGADSNSNGADFAVGAPDPQNAGTVTLPPPPPGPEAKTIAEIQGTGAESPLVDKTVVTDGVVTAAYPTGGFKGFYLQTPGTGGDVDLDTHKASDGLFVYLGSAPADTYPAVGDHVEVTGKVSEFGSSSGLTMTELTPPADGVKTLTEPAAAVKPAQVFYPGTDAARESLEGMLVEPEGRYTVADNYSLNQFGEIGLARGSAPLFQPTDVARPGSDQDRA